MDTPSSAMQGMLRLPGCGLCGCKETYLGPSVGVLCKCGHAVGDHTPITPLLWPAIQRDLDGVLIAVSNLLEREWPQTAGDDDSQGIILGHYRVAWFTFKAIRYLTADENDGFRMREFATAVPPLARSLLDVLANLVYFFQDDLSGRTREFIIRGFVEDLEKIDAHRNFYGDNPGWAEYIAELDAELKRIRGLLKDVSDDQLNSMKRFPTLGAMISNKGPDRIADDARRGFLKYLNEWFYKEYSQDAHLSAPGLYRRAGFLLKESRLWTDAEHDKVKIHSGGTLMSAIVLMLAIASEIEATLNLGVRARLVMVWTRLSHHSIMIWDMYQQRYLSLLG